MDNVSLSSPVRTPWTKLVEGSRRDAIQRVLNGEKYTEDQRKRAFETVKNTTAYLKKIASERDAL